MRKTETNFTAGNRWLVNLQKRGLFVQNGGCGAEGCVCNKRSKSWFHRSKNTDCRMAISSYVYHPIVGVAGWFCKPSFRSHSIWKYHSWVWSMVSRLFTFSLPVFPCCFSRVLFCLCEKCGYGSRSVQSKLNIACNRSGVFKIFCWQLE